MEGCGEGEAGGWGAAAGAGKGKGGGAKARGVGEAMAGYCRPLVHPAACRINRRASVSTPFPHFVHTLSQLGVLQAVDAPGGR